MTLSDPGETGWWAGPHHAGSGSSSTSADHDPGDVAAPVFLALLIGQQGQGGLLEVVGSTGSCGRHKALNHFLLPFHSKSITHSNRTQRMVLPL